MDVHRFVRNARGSWSLEENPSGCSQAPQRRSIDLRAGRLMSTKDDHLNTSWYGPCARCEKHWTQKVSMSEAGICRFCLSAMKAALDKQSLSAV
jgi:hypothetical protein